MKLCRIIIDYFTLILFEFKNYAKISKSVSVTMNCADFKQSSFGSLMDCSDEINNQSFWLGRGTKYLQDMSTGELQRIWFTKNKCFIPLKIRKIWFLREQNFHKLLIFHFVVHVDLRFIIDHSSSTFWSNIYLILNTIVVSFLR